MVNRAKSKEKSAPLWQDVAEHELVRLAKMGNVAAFEELLSRTTDICLRIAASILKSREDARDEVQNAFWLAYSRLELFTYQSKFSTWLVRIVINRCFLRLRSSQRRPVAVSLITTDDGRTRTYEAVTKETPEVDLGRQEVNQTLRRELRGIPPLLRIPIELHYINELPVKEVAIQLGLTISAVKSRLHRGQIFLRGRMLRHATRSGLASLTTSG